MQFDPNNPNIMAALNARLTKELGEMAAQNFARDIIGDGLIADCEALKQANADLVVKTTADRQLIIDLRAERDAFRAERDELLKSSKAKRAQKA